MKNLTNDELNLMCIYNTGTREGMIGALTSMRKHLEPVETELQELTESTLEKLEHMSDEEYAELELFPDFDE